MQEFNKFITSKLEQLKAIKVSPAERPNSPAMDNLLGAEHKALDHGFVRVVDYMGNDSAIVQAARVSYGAGTKEVNKDRGLIRYLMRHWHTTPFEMCELKIHVKLPMFVARQWIRHRTANVNEYSARYSVMPNEFYIPQAEHLAAQSSTNGQGRGDALQGEEAERALEWLRSDADNAYSHYQQMINEDDEGNIIDDSKQGLARELARMNLPVNAYTQWYWKIDLHNLFHFLRLRADPHAQYEIRVYAEIICDIVKQWLPIAYEAFEDYRLNAQQLSSMQTEAIKGVMLSGDTSATNIKYFCENSGMSKREAGDTIKMLRGGE